MKFNKNKFRNWDNDARIPPAMINYRGWIIPKDLVSFLPPDEILDKLPSDNLVIYTFDGLGYDLAKHKFVDA